MGLIDRDISTTKKEKSGRIKQPENKYKDWGIFGLGYRPGPSSIISSFRLKTSSEKIFKERLNKVAIHELGHNLGLVHCETPKCVMQDAVETIKTIDLANMELCKKCQAELD